MIFEYIAILRRTLPLMMRFRPIRSGVQSLLLHPLRSFLTTLGVLCGVAAVIAMLAVGEGASKEALERIRKLGSSNIIISAQKPTEDSNVKNTQAFTSLYGLNYADEECIRATYGEYVSKTVGAKILRMEGRLGERATEVRVVGTTPAWFELVRRPMVAGRALIQEDMDKVAPVCVLTEAGAHKLLAANNTLGQQIRLASNAFDVVGVVHSEPGSGGTIATPDEDADVYVPLSVARERWADVDLHVTAGARERSLTQLHKIIVEVKDTEHVEAVANSLEAMFKHSHKKVDYKLDVPLALLRQAEATKRTMNIVLGSIAGISLVVGGIGIMNIMLASVTERTREIGVRRAIGARKRQIVIQFLIEAIVLSTLGGVIGVIIGLILPWIITYFSGMPTVIPVAGVVVSLVISVGVGIFFGLYPAYRAANLDPIEALRHE